MLVCNSFSQKKIEGQITRKTDGKALPNVNISTNTKRATTSNTDGFYSIVVPDSIQSLHFSYLGYKDKTIAMGQKLVLDVLLEEDSNALNEIVITALGIKRESKELGYSIQSLQSKDLTAVKTVNFLDNLQSKIAGINVTQGATGVGSSSKITIRGESSFSNNNPLFVVDGVPINNQTVFNTTNEAAAGFQEIDFGNGAMEVNPDDVESVSVLKGPAAAALYGTRASNGVIVIKTKEGNKKKGFSVSINSSLTIDTAFKLPKFQNEYGQGQSGAFKFVDGLGKGISDNITYSWGPKLDVGNLVQQSDSPVQLPDGTVVRAGDTSLYSGLAVAATPFVSHPDNLKDFYKTGYTSIQNAAISNGFEQGNYRLSFTDLRTESIIPGVNLDRQTVAAKLNFEPSSKTFITTSINYINSNSDNRPSNGYGSENVNYSLVAWGPRSLDFDGLKNYWQPGLEGIQQYSYNYTFFDNPYFILLENRNSFVRDRVFGNLQIKQELAKKITLSVRTGMDYSSESRKFRRAFSSNRFIRGGYAEDEVKFREINTDFLINYNNHWGNFGIDTSVGGNALSQYASTTQIQTDNLAQPNVYSLNNAASPLQVFEFESEKKINSFYGLAKFSFKNFLYLDLTARNDWSSALATPVSDKNTSFFYPSVSTSFILSNKLQLPRFVSFAKLRASVAQVGNDTSPYQTAGSFVSQTTVYGLPTLTNQNSISNANLRPEQTTAYEIGTDLRFFRDRFNVDFTYFNYNTTNQIVSLPIAISSGFGQQVLNGGKVTTQGVEIVLGITPIKWAHFSWNTNFNFATSRAVVNELPQDGGRLTLGYSRIYDSANQTVFVQVEKGGRIGDLYGTGYLKNENGDFVLTDKGNYIADNNLKKIGNYNPDFTLGWINNLNYKSWNFSFVFDWRQGGQIVSRTRALGNVGGQLAETSYRPTEGIVAQGVVNTGTAASPVYVPNTTAITAESYYRQYYDRNHEENNVYDASFLKLRQLSLGYVFNIKGFVGTEKEADLSVSLIGNNIFAFTQNPHFDPEQLAVQGTGFVSGVENLSYASSRSLGFKLGLNF